MTYTVVGLLGRGGMAVVDLAIDDTGVEIARKRKFGKLVATDAHTRILLLERLA